MSIPLFGGPRSLSEADAKNLLRVAETYRTVAQGDRNEDKIHAAQYVATMAVLLLAVARASTESEAAEAMLTKHQFADHTDQLMRM